MCTVVEQSGILATATSTVTTTTGAPLAKTVPIMLVMPVLYVPSATMQSPCASLMAHQTMKVGWRSTLMATGALCVISTGTLLMPLWSADSWDMMVGYHSVPSLHIWLCLSVL